MRRFNLIEEQWIPVRLLDGGRKELGIQDALLQSQRIEAIEDSSPLVVAALHRFLLAVLYRALEGPTDIGQARKLFNEGLPADRITAYLKTWRDRFWLLDEKYPFWQVPDFMPKKWQPWLRMAADRNAENAKVLFDHSETNRTGKISFSLSARLLIAVQTFDLAVAKSEFVQPLDAPSARAALIIVVGRNLHETLCFGLKCQSSHITINDSAIWEREPEPVSVIREGCSKTITGYADLYTWRSRSVLFHNGHSDGIESLGFASGIRKEANSSFLDPMVCYKKSKEAGLIPIKFQEEKDFWRDFASLLPGSKDRFPLVIENAVELCSSVKRSWPRGFLVCGQKTKSGQAKVDFWRMEMFKLPLEIVGDKSACWLVSELLELAENVSEALKKSLRESGKAQITKGNRDLLPDQWIAGKLQQGDVSRFVLSTNCLQFYWSILEFDFHEILELLNNDSSYEDIRCQWLKAVRCALKTSWSHYRASIVNGDAWAIRALVKAEGPVQRKIYQLNQEIQKLELQEEAT